MVESSLTRALLAHRVFVQTQGISPFGHTPPHARIQGLMSQRRARFQSLLPRCPCAGLTLCGGPLCPQALNRYIGLPQGLERATPLRKEQVGAHRDSESWACDLTHSAVGNEACGSSRSWWEGFQGPCFHRRP